MVNLINKNNCCGCSACVSVCPTKCISMKEDDEGFLYPTIESSKCINCRKCESICPFIKKIPKAKYQNVYVGYANDLQLRILSSSGGIFSVMAENILNQNGVVYGVKMSQDCEECNFVKVSTLKELSALRGSKYLQSKSIGIFEEIEKELKNNKQILFSGTPCQVNALKSFLQKEYNNLLCVDFVCHGVPSPLLWKKYLKHFENKKRCKITDVNFRDKSLNWLSFGISMKSNKKSFFIPRSHSSFFQMFMKNLSLRPSCYNCKAKRNRFADITIGDFWGIENALRKNILSKFDYEKGCSLIITRNIKGEKFINNLKKLLELESLDYKDAIFYNDSEYISVNLPKEREKFFLDMNNLNYEELEDKYIYPKFKHQIKKFLIEYKLWNIIEKFR